MQDSVICTKRLTAPVEFNLAFKYDKFHQTYFTGPEIVSYRTWHQKLFSCSPYAMRRVRGLRFIRLMRVAEEDDRALAFRKLTGEGGSVVDHLNYLTVRRAGSLDGWVRVGTGGR